MTKNILLIITLIIVLVGVIVLFKDNPQIQMGDRKLNLNESITLDGVTITPLVITEDSRCAKDVQCIWAGRAVVQTRLKNSSDTKVENIELGKSVTFGTKVVNLVSVGEKDDYYFEYTVKNPSVGKCYVGGCSAQICSDQPDVVSTCEYTAAYGCYKNATCERQANGQCGWTETASLRLCLNTAR